MIVNFLITLANETSIFDDGSYLHTKTFVNKHFIVFKEFTIKYKYHRMKKILKTLSI